MKNSKKRSPYWRVVEAPFLGVLAQTMSMVTAIGGYWLGGASVATYGLIVLAITMYATNHLPTTMSALANIPIIWLAFFIEQGITIPQLIILFVIATTLHLMAAITTHEAEPVIQISSRLAWQITVSTTVFTSCFTIQNSFPVSLIIISFMGLVVVWSWALLVQPKKI